MRPFLTLHHPAAARAWYARGSWREETLYDLLAGHAAVRPDAAAARDGRRRLGWGEMLAWVDAVAARLHGLGVTSGDRVSIWSDNGLESIALFLACARHGIACNPSLHRTHTSSEVVALLDRLGSKVLLTRDGWGADGVPGGIAAALRAAPSLRAVWTPATFPPPAVDGPVRTAPHAPASPLPVLTGRGQGEGQLLAPIPDPAPHPALSPCQLAWGEGENPPPPSPDPDKVVYLAFTSGTTGQPKCVMHSDNTLLANARDLVRDWGHGPSTRLLTLSPLSHHIAWVAVAQWLVAGCELITDDPPPGTNRLDWIVETGATYVMGVPTHAMDVLAEQKRRGLARLGAVEVFYMAGAPIPPTVAAAFVAQGIRPQNVYGMTENSSHQYTHPADATETIVTTCGRGGPAYEVRVFDAADPDREAPAGTIGQVAGRGAALMLGYFDNQAATAGSFNRDGWFLSGDLGRIDADGNLTIEGRLKDLIIRGGHNIYPATIEALALRHPGVERCAAFPVVDERLGERVCLAVVGSAEPADLLAHLAREGLSRYDMPEFFLRVATFPLTASGKILKRTLIEMTRRGELVPETMRPATRAAHP